MNFGAWILSAMATFPIRVFNGSRGSLFANRLFLQFALQGTAMHAQGAGGS